MGDSKKNTEERTYLSQRKAEDIVTRLNKCLSKHNDIAFAFLFGSSVHDQSSVFSDVDIAIYFAGTTDFYRINNLREELSALLGKEIDIVVLNNASPILRMQVLKKGRLIVDLNRRLYHAFFSNTVKEYDDLKRNRKDIEDNILRGRIYA